VRPGASPLTVWGLGRQPPGRGDRSLRRCKRQGAEDGPITQSADAADSVETDFHHWSALLRSVSGFMIYRKV